MLTSSSNSIQNNCDRVFTAKAVASRELSTTVEQMQIKLEEQLKDKLSILVDHKEAIAKEVHFLTGLISDLEIQLDPTQCPRYKKCYEYIC